MKQKYHSPKFKVSFANQVHCSINESSISENKKVEEKRGHYMMGHGLTLVLYGNLAGFVIHLY
jgi:hypothetical protein